MSKFRVGDVVQRIGCPFGDLEIGDTGWIITISELDGCIKLNSSTIYYDPEMFILYEEEN